MACRTEYSIKDHLGNARVSFTDLSGDGKIDVTNITTTNEIIQENHYYAFGMTHEGPWMMNNTAKDNAYMYNSKEYNGDHGLAWSDYGARWYDAAIGRFGTSDPLSDIAPGWTPYRYGFNNPMSYTDPTGMAEESAGAQATHNQMMMQNKARTDAAGRNEMWEKGGNGAPDIGDSSSESASESSSETESNNSQKSKSSDPPKKGDMKYDPFGGYIYDGAKWIFIPNLKPYGASFPSDSPIDWVVGALKTPMIMAVDYSILGFAKFSGKTVFIKGIGQVDNILFHRTIKPNILKNSGNFFKEVGKNPDVFVESGEIFLKGTGSSFKNKIFNTGLNPDDYFNL